MRIWSYTPRQWDSNYLRHIEEVLSLGQFFFKTRDNAPATAPEMEQYKDKLESWNALGLMIIYGIEEHFSLTLQIWRAKVHLPRVHGSKQTWHDQSQKFCFEANVLISLKIGQLFPTVRLSQYSKSVTLPITLPLNLPRDTPLKFHHSWASTLRKWPRVMQSRGGLLGAGNAL